MLRHALLSFLTLFCGVCGHLNLPEGSKCTRDGVEGQCVRSFRCLSTFLDTETKEYAPICSFDGKDPIICCTDCQLVNDTRTIIYNKKLGFLYKTGPKAKDKCLEYMDTLNYPCKYQRIGNITRILNKEKNCYNITEDIWSWAYAASEGYDAVRDQFPHMALLGYGENTTTAEWLCGGSVISERYILTAAHCLAGPSVGQVKYIALGILKRTDPVDLWQIYNVKRMIAHPEYKPPSKYNDIALLETETPIVFSDTVQPACLHTEGEAEPDATATGWGALGHRSSLANVLQAVYLTRFGEAECSEFYPKHRHLQNGYDHATQMCYGDRFIPRDTCEGDSGGPLQSQNYYSHWCVYTVIGVTSYGRQCGISSGSGMYTRVYHFVPWIESIVWPD